MTNITILGSGFAALTALRALRAKRVAAAITIISPRDHLHYLPSIIWMPPHLRCAEELEIPLTGFFTRMQARYVKASVTALTEGGRVVKTDAGSFRNDHLIIATGGRFIRKLPGIEHALIPCEGIAAGEKITRCLDDICDRVRTDGSGGAIAVGFGANPKEPGAVRGGPMFELLFIIESILRQKGLRDKIALHFFSGAERPGKRLGDKAVDGLLAEMKKRNIRTHLGHKPVRFEADKVVTEAEEIATDMILFMPGITGPAWLEKSDLPRSEGGMIRANALCQVEDRPNVWVAGDAGSFPGPEWMPKQAHQADLQAKAIAANIRDQLNGDSADTAFRPELVCIMDMLDAGMLVFRNSAISLTLPRLKIFHWLKGYFENLYLQPYH